jgi:L,D-transpeptidase YcbB
MKWKMIPLIVLVFLLCSACEDGNRISEKNAKKEAAPQLQQKDASPVPKLVLSSGQLKAALSEDDIKQNLFHQEELDSLYKIRNYAPIWTDEASVKELYRSLKNAELEGLSFSSYHGDELDRLMQQVKGAAEAEKAARLELLFSDAYLQYARDLFYGKLDPTILYKDWGVKREKKNFGELLVPSSGNVAVEKTLEELKPQHDIYRQLKKSLLEYRQLKEEEKKFSAIPEGDLIKPGQKDQRLLVIAQRLQDLKLLDSATVSRDSSYTNDLEIAVRNFQKSKALQADGIIGNSTIKELNKGATQRYEQILANLERWRWYPRDLGDHHILINIPNYKLAVVKDGDTIRAHNVIAGSKARPTPIFSDALQYIVINPEWRIPPTIKKQDVIPKASKDPNYLSSHNMTVTASTGEQLDPSTIDWSSPKVQSFSFVQSAGPSNPLGRIKIIYPNKYMIYLHDTPSKSLFERSERAESSGCVRVEQVQDLAAHILEEQTSWSLENIQEAIASGKTKQIKISRPIQVHHFYWTAWRTGNKTEFVNDIYNLDREIYTRLQEYN